MNSIPPPPNHESSGYIAVITASIVAASGFLGTWLSRHLTSRHEKSLRSEDIKRERERTGEEADVKARLNIYEASELLIKDYRQERDKLLDRIDSQTGQIDILSQDKLNLMFRVNTCEIKIATLTKDGELTRRELQKCHETSQELQARCDQLVEIFNGLSEAIRAQLPAHPILKILPPSIEIPKQEG